MNPHVSRVRLASYLAGVALGAGLLASAAIGGAQVRLKHWQPMAALALCSGQVSFIQADRILARAWG